MTATVARVKAWTVVECSKKTPDEWKKGYAEAAHDVRRALASPVAPLRVTVVGVREVHRTNDEEGTVQMTRFDVWAEGWNRGQVPGDVSLLVPWRRHHE